MASQASSIHLPCHGVNKFVLRALLYQITLSRAKFSQHVCTGTLRVIQHLTRAQHAPTASPKPKLNPLRLVHSTPVHGHCATRAWHQSSGKVFCLAGE